MGCRHVLLVSRVFGLKPREGGEESGELGEEPCVGGE